MGLIGGSSSKGIKGKAAEELEAKLLSAIEGVQGRGRCDCVCVCGLLANTSYEHTVIMLVNVCAAQRSYYDLWCGEGTFRRSTPLYLCRCGPLITDKKRLF